jgi:hypothetical protein
MRGRSSSRRGRGSASKPATRPPGLEGLGPFSLRILAAAGIQSRADLDRVGPVAAFLSAKQLNAKVSFNLLWGLAGAYTNTHWTELTDEYRSALLREYDASCDLQQQLGASSSNKRLSGRGGI